MFYFTLKLDVMITMFIRGIFRYLREFYYSYEQLVKINISRSRLLYNLHVFQGLNDNVKIAPVLKSNAYGHGLILIARLLDGQNLPFFVVDSYHEALVLRTEGMQTPLLIIGFTTFGNIIKRHLDNVCFSITSLDDLKKISAELKIKKSFHLKIDTGMHRQGIALEEIEEAKKLLQKNKNIILKGVFSHLADADSIQDNFTLQQIEKWNEIVDIFKRDFLEIKYYHLAATSGSFYLQKIKANVMRVGLGLYGMNLNPNLKLGLRPVLEMRAILGSVKNLKPGDKVGYSTTFEAKEKMKIATVPLGYFEGVDRRLSNYGYFKIKDKFCPIIGRVSMNITTIDVSKTEDPKIGDEVVVISRLPEDKNSLMNIAKTCDMLPYEVMVHLPDRLHREEIE